MKFGFTNPSHLPHGIPERQIRNGQSGSGIVRQPRPDQVPVRTGDQVVDQIHQGGKYTGGDQSLGEIGRVREGRVDTGKPVIQNLEKVQVAMIRRGLANISFPLVNIHWFKQVPGGDPRKTRGVVAASFSDQTVTNAQQPLVINPEVQAALRALARVTWGFVHIWQNPNGVVTINCIHRRPDGRPRHALVVRDRTLTYVPVMDPIEEGLE